ncbi:hypothetical protein [Candidatus Thioglobus sp.]|uniref:hypothetical protein n=1 Tax=Candidatus Thioglobus sp. TaxID=2026721 RepID=UPI003D0B2D95
MIDNYQRPTVEELIDLVLTGGYATGDHIDQLHIPEITKKLNIKNKKNGHIHYAKLSKKKIIKIALLCFEELLKTAKNKGLIKNNYECSLVFELNPLFIYHDPSYQNIEDESDYATIISTKQDINFPNNYESFVKEFNRKYSPPELFLIDRNLDSTKKECNLNYLDIEKYIGDCPYSIICGISKEEVNHGIYYNRHIRVSV